MRKTKRVKLDEQEITVKELTVKEWLDLMQQGEDLGVELLQQNLPLFVEGMTLDELMTLAPSELETVYAAFKEVNAVFFKVAQALGMDNILIQARAAVITNLSSQLSGSVPRATPTSGITA